MKYKKEPDPNLIRFGSNSKEESRKNVKSRNGMEWKLDNVIRSVIM